MLSKYMHTGKMNSRIQELYMQTYNHALNTYMYMYNYLPSSMFESMFFATYQCLCILAAIPGEKYVYFQSLFTQHSCMHIYINSYQANVCAKSGRHSSHFVLVTHSAVELSSQETKKRYNAVLEKP